MGGKPVDEEHMLTGTLRGHGQKQGKLGGSPEVEAGDWWQ
jgi:hypothetical protein